jgi:Sec-independent protein translocase protein TatA
MEFLGIGPMEFIFIVLIILIIMGPKDMSKAGLSIGRFLRKVVTSDWWRTFREASKELGHLPNKLIREAGLEEEAKELNEGLADIAKVSQIDFKELDKELGNIKPPEFNNWVTQPDIDAAHTGKSNTPQPASSETPVTGEPQPQNTPVQAEVENGKNPGESQIE